MPFQEKARLLQAGALEGPLLFVLARCLPGCTCTESGCLGLGIEASFHAVAARWSLLEACVAIAQAVDACTRQAGERIIIGRSLLDLLGLLQATKPLYGFWQAQQYHGNANLHGDRSQKQSR